MQFWGVFRIARLGRIEVNILLTFFLQIYIYFITGTNNDENIEIVPIKRIEMENSPRNGVIYQP